MDRTAGWRTRRSSLRSGHRVDGRGEPPQQLQPLPPDPATPAGALEHHDTARGFPWQNVGWSISLAGLFAYIWAVTTYSVPIGAASMIVALVGLLFLPQGVRLPPFLLVFAAFVGWAFIGTIETDYPEAVKQKFEVLWKVGLISLVVVNALRTRAQQRAFMFVFLGAFALYPARGTIFNYLGGYTVFGRALWNNVFANPNDLAALTLLQLSMALALYIREPKGWPKLAAIAGMVLLPIIVLLTQSRGGFLGLAVFAAMVVMGQRKKGKTIILVGLVGVAVAMAAPSSAWQRLGGILKLTDTENLREVDQEGSAEQRFEIWRVARRIAGDHLLFGVGVGAYPKAHGVYAMSPDFKRTARGERDTHSTFLNVLAETGVVGLALFLTLFSMVILKAERVRRRAAQLLPHSAQQILYLELGLLAFFTAGIFGSYGGLAFTYVHLALLWTVSETIAGELAAARIPIRAR